MMKQEQYLAQRNELVTAAEALIAEGKFEDSQLKMQEIEALDNQFENTQKELANLNALKQQTMIDIENKSINEGELTTMTQVENVQNKSLNELELMENAFAKTVMNKPLSANEQAVFTEMNNVTYAEDNQVVIPKHVVDEIIGLISEEHPFFGDARKFFYKGVLTLPKHKAIKSGDAKFYSEKTATEVEENEFVDVRLEGKEVAKLIEVSFKIESMSVPAFMQYLKDELVDRIGELVGSKVFTGNGTDEFKGVVTELSTTAQKVEYDATAGLKYTDLTTAFGMLKSQFANGAAIYANNATVWNKLATILDGNGNPIFIADPAVGGVGRLFGFPVKVDGGVPDNMFVFGNAKKGYAVNEVKPITVETDKDLKARTTQFLGHSIMDGAVTDERALVLVAPSA